jgi:hypothetical protein
MAASLLQAEEGMNVTVLAPRMQFAVKKVACAAATVRFLCWWRCACLGIWVICWWLSWQVFGWIEWHSGILTWVSGSVLCILLAFVPVLSPYWLVRSPKVIHFEWPSADKVREELAKAGYFFPPKNDTLTKEEKQKELLKNPRHLKLGMTRFAMRDAVLKLLPGYARTEEWIGKLPGASEGYLGYDLTAAIKCKWKEVGLQDFSVAEVLYAMGHHGVTWANTFISHVQSEKLTDTLTGIRGYAEQQWDEPVFWLDYFSLGQCRSDFTLNLVEKVIRDISLTVLLSERVGHRPKATERSFCLFEWYATLKGSPCRFVIKPISTRCGCCVVIARLIHAGLYHARVASDGDFYQINCEVAACRDEKSKAEIDEKVRSEMGFEKLNEILTSGLKEADNKIITDTCKAALSKAATIHGLVIVAINSAYVFDMALGDWSTDPPLGGVGFLIVRFLFLLVLNLTVVCCAKCGLLPSREELVKGLRNARTGAMW